MKLYKLLSFIALFTSIYSFGNVLSCTGKKHEKTKTINRQYSVNDNASLFISNKYGDLNIETWNQNRIEILVKITVKGNDLDKVQAKLDAISVDFNGSKDLVDARTKIRKVNSSWSSWWKNNNTSFKISYFVKMPRTNNADLNNKYGNISLDELEGKSNITCDYGNIDIEKLSNTNNRINLSYCGASEINYVNTASISADYSLLKVNKADFLKLSADYSTLKLGTVNGVKYNLDYGSLTVQQIANIAGGSDYAAVKVGSLTKTMTSNSDYGSIKVASIEKGFEKVSINSSYASVKLGTPEDNNFKFTIDLSYAGFRYPSSAVDMHKSVKKSTKKYYEGVFGNESSSTVTVRSSYGGVSLKINN